MKEATGELNMTVVTVVAIAAVAAFFYAFVWPGIRNSITASTNCSQAQCDAASCTVENGQRKCTSCMYGENFSEGPITCTYQDNSEATE